MSTKEPPSLSELDHIARNPNTPVKFMVIIRCIMLSDLANHIAASGHLDSHETRIAEHCLSALHPYRSDEKIDQIEQHFFEIFLDDIIRYYLHGHYGNGVSIFRSSRYPSGSYFDNFVFRWRKNIIDKYLLDSYVYLSPLRHFLLIDFEQNLNKILLTPEYRASHASELKKRNKIINRPTTYTSYSI